MQYVQIIIHINNTRLKNINKVKISIFHSFCINYCINLNIELRKFGIMAVIIYYVKKLISLNTLYPGRVIFSMQLSSAQHL